ncbi:MAG: DUF4340 domain-containing protein [Oscillospiraceae bacterium]|nr:DUF4340 domain-containing protein [Oscillospiraceae bacterium]
MSSKKIIIAVAVLLVLLGGAIGGYIAVDRSKQKEEAAIMAESAAMRLFNYDPDTIGSVRFDNDEGHFLITAETGEWQITETDYPDEIRLNTYYVNAVVNYMSELTATQKFDVPAENLASYGLASPAVITLSDGAQEYVLNVGTASVTQDYWYVMKPGDSTVYAVDYSKGEILRGGTSYLKDRLMLESSDVKIDGFRLMKGNEAVADLVKKNNLWEMNAPLKDANVNSASVNQMLTSLTRIEYDGFAGVAKTADDLKKFGLDKPEYTLTVTCGDVKEELLFVSKQPSGMYVLNKASGQVAEMNGTQASFLGLKPEEILIKKLVELSYENARSLTVQVDDVSFEMTMDTQAGTCALDGKDLSGMSDNVRLLHRNLYDTVANLAWDELDIKLDIPEDIEPAASFTFTDSEGKTTVLMLYPSGEENVYIAALNGQNTHMTVRRRSLTGNTGVLSFYEKLTDAVAAE